MQKYPLLIILFIFPTLFQCIKFGPSAHFSQQIEDSFGLLPTFIKTLPQDYADIYCQKIISIYATNSSLISSKHKLLSAYGLTLGLEQGHTEFQTWFKNAAQLYGATAEEFSFVQLLSANAKFRSIVDTVKKVNPKRFEKNLLQQKEFIKKLQKQPNIYDPDELFTSKKQDLGLSKQSEEIAIKLFGVIPYEIDEMPTEYAEIYFQQIKKIKENNTTFSEKIKNLIMLPMMAVMTGFSDRIIHENKELAKLYGSSEIEIAEVSAYAGFIMEEILMNQIAGMDNYQQDTMQIYEHIVKQKKNNN